VAAALLPGWGPWGLGAHTSHSRGTAKGFSEQQHRHQAETLPLNPPPLYFQPKIRFTSLVPTPPETQNGFSLQKG